MPASWADDRDRCAEAGIGDDVPFTTKPELAQRMLARLVDAGAVGWFTADLSFGDNPGLRTWLEDQQIDFVMVVSCDARTTPTPA